MHCLELVNVTFLISNTVMYFFYDLFQFNSSQHYFGIITIAVFFSIIYHSHQNISSSSSPSPPPPPPSSPSSSSSSSPPPPPSSSSSSSSSSSCSSCQSALVRFPVVIRYFHRRTINLHPTSLLPPYLLLAN